MSTATNTPSNKAKFFAQYWGQDIVFDYVHGNKYPLQIGYMSEGELNRAFLELKPLSQITDEDALVAYRFHWAPECFEDIEEANKRDIPVAVEWLQNYGKPKYIKLTIEGADFLRSKGYALPYMDISVEQQIEFGWIRLNTHISNLNTKKI